MKQHAQCRLADSAEFAFARPAGCSPLPHPRCLAPHHPPCICAPLCHSITNDEAAKAGRVSFRGHTHSHATGPDEHAYQLDLELYGEVDEQDIKQAGAEAVAELGRWGCA